jgi:hypothetical protein
MALYILLRVQLQVERRCELPNVRNWYLADNATAPAFVRYWSNSGQRG